MHEQPEMFDDDVYSEDNVLLENGEITPEEEGFMQGYRNAGNRNDEVF